MKMFKKGIIGKNCLLFLQKLIYPKSLYKMCPNSQNIIKFSL